MTDFNLQKKLLGLCSILIQQGSKDGQVPTSCVALQKANSQDKNFLQTLPLILD